MNQAPGPGAPLQLQPIGFVSTDVPDDEVRWRRREMVSEIRILPPFVDCLAGLGEYSHIFVLFWLHRVEPGTWQPRVHPRGRSELPLTGLFTTRVGNRPNPVGLAVCELLDLKDDTLRVRRLDAYSGTPVIDIKPYDPYDAVAEPRLPEWWRRLGSPAST